MKEGRETSIKLKKSIKIVCDQGKGELKGEGRSEDGCMILADIEEKQRNINQARQLYKKACDQSDRRYVCFSLILLEDKYGNIQQSRKIYKETCDQGKIKDCMILGDLEKRRGSIDQAKRLYKKLCDAGEVDGCFSYEEFIK